MSKPSHRKEIIHMVVDHKPTAGRSRIEELLRLQIEVEILDIASREGLNADKARLKRISEIEKRITELEKASCAATSPHRISL
jgi:hypothetical protein